MGKQQWTSPIMISQEDALLEVQRGGLTHMSWTLAETVLAANVTPLQAQAVLVRAWSIIQKTGHLAKRSRVCQPNISGSASEPDGSASQEM